MLDWCPDQCNRLPPLAALASDGTAALTVNTRLRRAARTQEREGGHVARQQECRDLRSGGSHRRCRGSRLRPGGCTGLPCRANSRAARRGGQGDLSGRWNGRDRSSRRPGRGGRREARPHRGRAGRGDRCLLHRHQHLSEGHSGDPIVDLSPENFALPIETYTRATFLTATRAARHMVEKGSGVIMTITSTPSRTAVPRVGGMAAAWAAIESLWRTLAAEVGPKGIRVVCLRPGAIPETPQIQEVFGIHAESSDTRPEEFQARSEERTLLGKLPTLAEVANVAAFVASDQSSPMTGTVVNLSGGSIVE